MTIRLIKHEVIPNCGSYEVRYSDGRPSRYFYWDDLPGRGLPYQEHLSICQRPRRQPCVYRKLKLGRSDGEVRQGWRVI